ncbi:MAG: hypothetical protein KAX69_01890 [Chitinophagales bacterium]|nr:hypothetical protein [Chitinophagales bacterium]
MAKLTTQQANELANNFLAMAQAIGEYRYQNFDSLSKIQNQKIRDLHWSILNYADDLYTMSATLVLNDVEESLSTIGLITEQMKDTYKHLQNIQKAISVAASVITLGASILSKNPQAIISAIGGLADTWNA